MKTLGQMAERFDIELFAYVLMSNHYHLLLRTHHANLSKGMHWLGTTYTRRFNLRHRRVGHLFQARYKSILVEDDAYLMQLSCYIHRNPIRAGLVKRLIDYRWRPLGPYFLFRMPLLSPPAKFGDNELGVRLTNRVGMAKRMLNAQEFEVEVSVK